MALTKEQFTQLHNQGLSVDQIVSFEQGNTPQATPAPQKDLLQKTGDVVNSIFPGKQVGQAIGTAIGAGIAKLKGNYQNYDLSAPSPLQVGGDIAQGALTVAAPNVGTGATAAGRIAANTALGAGLGASNAVAQGEGGKDVLKKTGEGALVSGAVSTAGEGVKSLVDNLPKWLTKTALPKLDNKNIPYALENTKIGSLDTLKTHSNSAMRSYEDTIQSVLNHPEYKNSIGGTPPILNRALSNFPNSQYTVDELVNNAQDIAPSVGKLISKFSKGEANIQEINTIRKELDRATASVYTSINRPPEKKLLGAALSNAMREYVQTNAPETQSIFQRYAQEVGLNKAIGIAVKKGEQKVRLSDIAAAVGGYAHSGLSGAFQAVVAERLLLNPAAQLGAAKVLQSSSNAVAPAANAVMQGIKAPLVKEVTNKNSK